jgi:hypothetical protein
MELTIRKGCVSVVIETPGGNETDFKLFLEPKAKQAFHLFDFDILAPCNLGGGKGRCRRRCDGWRLATCGAVYRYTSVIKPPVSSCHGLIA